MPNSLGQKGGHLNAYVEVKNSKLQYGPLGIQSGFSLANLIDFSSFSTKLPAFTYVVDAL